MSNPWGSWTEQAACAEPGVDPETFFPEPSKNARAAKEICARCPVTIPCLNAAMFHQNTTGVWGGLSERERRRLKRLIAA